MPQIDLTPLGLGIAGAAVVALIGLWLLRKRIGRGVRWLLGLPKRAWALVRDGGQWAWLRQNYWIVMLGVGLALGALAGVFYLAEIAVSVIAMVDRLEATARDPASNADQLRSLATGVAVLLGALAAATTLIFQLVRVWISERTTRAAEEGLVTDRINKAVEGLGAEKVVRRLVETPRYRKTGGEWERDADGNPVPALRPDGQPLVDRESYDVTEPNLEVRIGAIYALERIGQDSPRDHIQIMEILCAYVRENSRAREVEWFPDGPWPRHPPEPEKDELVERRALRRARLGGTRADRGAPAVGRARSWARNSLSPVRPDVDVAMQVIGRRSEELRRRELAAGYKLDLNGANLQSLSLVRAALARANFKDAMLTGASFSQTDLSEADLSGAGLSGARFADCQLDGAEFQEASMEGTRIATSSARNARFFRTLLAGARIDRTDFRGANMLRASLEGADVFRSDLRETKLYSAGFQGAAIWATKLGGADMTYSDLTMASLQSVELDGVKFDGARFLGTDVVEARIDAATEFKGAATTGAVLHRTDLRPAGEGLDLSETFGDPTVRLRDDQRTAEFLGPEYWIEGDVSDDEARRRLNAFLEEFGLPPRDD